ncbi:MAG: SDR family NAD(P)-dependent oxidoreductase [Spirochaetaceae bacterium]|nr:SDR family NAD(P)-dependent oxidoreductase [Spirochaetaceae bacterium]
MDKKVILITGGATRLAKELAKSLVSDNYLVIVHYNQSENDANLLKEELGRSCEIIQYNFLDNESKVFFEKVLSKFGRLDIIINAASIFSKQSLGEIDEKMIENYNIIHSNVPLLLTIYLYEHLVIRNERGSVINFTDAGLNRPSLNRIPYFLSKSSLSFQTKLLAKELAPYVRVNELAPGLIMPNNKDKDYFAKMEDKIKLGLGSYDDIIFSVNYLLNAKYITGEKIKVDGGLYF